MRILFLTIFIAGLVFALVAAFIVPEEDRRAIAASIRNSIPEEWRPVERVKRFIAGPSIQPVQLTPLEPVSIETIKETSGDAVGDWTYNCEARVVTGRKCSLSQQISDPDGIVVFSWVISIDPQGQFNSKWQTVTGVMVNRGILLDAGTEQPIRLPYSSCVSGYCEVDAKLGEDFVDTLSNTSRAIATVQPIIGPAVTYTISTRGLADGLRALRDSVRES